MFFLKKLKKQVSVETFHLINYVVDKHYVTWCSVKCATTPRYTKRAACAILERFSFFPYLTHSKCVKEHDYLSYHISEKKHLIHPEYGFCIDCLLFSFRPFLDESPLIPVSLTKPTSGGQFLWRFVQSKPTSQLVSLYILEETRSDEDKPRKNCECSPSYSLTVSHKPSMS